MQQTFYIDIDEEITSIVEKLRKAKASEAVLVVSKRALLIQSIVNLKLLKKEADKLGLKISIITQDKLGKMLIEKAGISIQQKTGDDHEEQEYSDAKHEKESKKELKKEVETAALRDKNISTKKRLKKIGSTKYFTPENKVNSFSEKEKEKSLLTNNSSRNKKILVNNETDNKKKKVQKKKNISTMDLTRPSASRNNSRSVSEEANHLTVETTEEESHKDQELKKFFCANNFSDKIKENCNDRKQKIAETSRNKFFKRLLILSGIVLFFGFSYLAYLYVPKAKVTIFVKKDVKSVDKTIIGNVSYETIDYEEFIIPAKLMEFDKEVTETFKATGSKNVSNKKAKGKITIYNKFSSSPQPLVATTRFLSKDQKIFRLVQGVTVPGTTNVSGEIKPGVIEVEVVADESGSSFNIPATSFTIPGFKNSGNEKYTKIYAKSASAMSGGGNSDEKVKVVTDKDINAAKDKISLEIESIVKKKIKDSATSGTIILDDAILINEPVYRLSNAEGEMANNFEIKVSAHARALVFLESDIKKIANSIISKSGNGKINIDSSSIVIDYGKSVIDNEFGIIEIKMHASDITKPDLDLENIKKDILGKNSEELTKYLNTYSNIEKAEVEYFPQLFVSKIPLNKKRVEIILNATMP